MTPTRRIPTHLLILGAALLVPALAQAQAGRDLADPDEAATSSSGDPSWPMLMPEGWALDVSVQTSVPLSIGAEAQLQTPIGIFFNVGGGHIPNAYLSMLGDLVQGTGAFGDDVRPLLDETVANGGWNFRGGIGLNPVEGLELGFGYTYLAADSTLTRGAIESATGQRIRYRGMREVPISVDIHALYGRLGYRFVIADHFVIRAAVGWTHAVGASVRLDVPDEVRAIEDNPATEIENAVDEGFSNYGFTPEILLSAGYRF